MLPLLEHFSKHYGNRTLQHQVNQEHVEKILHQIISSCQTVWVAEVGIEIVGMLISRPIESFWNPDIILLQEIAFWVEPEYRGVLTAGRLLQQYVKYAKQHRMPAIFTTLADSDLDLTGFGFEECEKMWWGEF